MSVLFSVYFTHTVSPSHNIIPARILAILIRVDKHLVLAVRLVVWCVTMLYSL